jgi:hypothetical protein
MRKKSGQTVHVRRALDGHALCEKLDDERGAAKTQIADRESRSAYMHLDPKQDLRVPPPARHALGCTADH